MTRKFLFSAVAVLAAASAAQAQLMITEIVDATLPSGLPKFVELKNVSSATVDLSGFSLGNANNGAPTLGFDALVLSGLLAPGDTYVVSYESGDSPGSSTFFDVYGFDADNLDPGSFINGDDVLILYAGAALAGSDLTGAIDVYGVLGTDGSGEPWDYTDGYSFRNPDVMSPNPVFTLSEWTIGGANSLETGDDLTELPLIQSLTTPGTHNMVPEPASVAMVLLAGSLAGAVSMRSRLG